MITETRSLIVECSRCGNVRTEHPDGSTVLPSSRQWLQYTLDGSSMGRLDFCAECFDLFRAFMGPTFLSRSAKR